MLETTRTSHTRGLVIVSIDDPLRPEIVQRIGAPVLRSPRSIAIQFRYGFIVDDDGLKVIDITSPGQAQVIAGASVALGDARDVYVARTYAYVANGKEGIAIDARAARQPRLDQVQRRRKINDVKVKIAILCEPLADGAWAQRLEF